MNGVKIAWMLFKNNQKLYKFYLAVLVFTAKGHKHAGIYFRRHHNHDGYKKLLDGKKKQID